MPRLAAALVAVVVAAPAWASPERLQLQVIDARGAALEDARVQLACGTTTVAARSDAEGRVTMPRPADLSICTLLVDYPQLAPFLAVLHDAPWPERVQLGLTVVHEQVDVSAPRPADSPRLSGARAATIEREEFERTGASVSSWVEYAKAVAGATGVADDVRVDGFPSRVLPPRQAVQRIAINSDPFSAEFATADHTQIDIETRSPDRAVHIGGIGSALGFGGRNPLTPGTPAESRNASLQASGGVPWLPVVAAGEGGWSHDAMPASVADGTAVVPRTRHANVNAIVFRDTANTEWRGLFYDDRGDASSAGAGGVTRLDAALEQRQSRREGRLTVRGMRGTIRYRGGVGYASSASDATGHATQPAVSILGVFNGGAAQALLDRTRDDTATFQSVVEVNRSRPFQIGVAGSHTTVQLARTPNPFGMVVFATADAYEAALGGDETGTRFVQDGNGLATASLSSVAVFAQTAVVSSSRGAVRIGLRMDAQTHDAWRWSPRVSGRLERAGFTLSGGAGVFNQPWPADLFAAAALRDASHLRELVGPDARVIATEIGSAFRRPRDVIVRGDIGRAFGRVQANAEYSATAGRFYAGSRRLPVPDGWRDVITSSYGMRRNQLHLRVSTVVAGQSLTGHYQRTRVRDQSSGAFAAESAGAPPAWAASSGIAPWHAGAVAALRLPASISATIVASAEGPLPYDVTAASMTDAYLFTDRAGRERNSGRAPGIRSIDMSAVRRVALPPWRGMPRGVDIGAQVTNLLGSRQHTAFGSVFGTSVYGQPLAALPGRACRVWVTF